jgi:hypothetical protein
MRACMGGLQQQQQLRTSPSFPSYTYKTVIIALIRLWLASRCRYILRRGTSKDAYGPISHVSTAWLDEPQKMAKMCQKHYRQLWILSTIKEKGRAIYV